MTTTTDPTIGENDRIALLQEMATDARRALRSVGPSAHPSTDNPLYYPLLFLTEAVEGALRNREASLAELRADIERAADWFARSRAATPSPTPEAPADAR